MRVVSGILEVPSTIHCAFAVRPLLASFSGFASCFCEFSCSGIGRTGQGRVLFPKGKAWCGSEYFITIPVTSVIVRSGYIHALRIIPLTLPASLQTHKPHPISTLGFLILFHFRSWPWPSSSQSLEQMSLSPPVIEILQFPIAQSPSARAPALPSVAPVCPHLFPSRRQLHRVYNRAKGSLRLSANLSLLHKQRAPTSSLHRPFTFTHNSLLHLER